MITRLKVSDVSPTDSSTLHILSVYFVIMDKTETVSYSLIIP